MFLSFHQFHHLQTTTHLASLFLSHSSLSAHPRVFCLSAQRPQYLWRRGSGTTMHSRLPTAFVTASAGSQEEERGRGETWEGDGERVGKERKHHCTAFGGHTNHISCLSNRERENGNLLPVPCRSNNKLFHFDMKPVDSREDEKEETRQQTLPLVQSYNRGELGERLHVFQPFLYSWQQQHKFFVNIFLLFWEAESARHKGNNGFKPLEAFTAKHILLTEPFIPFCSLKNWFWKQKTVWKCNFVTNAKQLIPVIGRKLIKCKKNFHSILFKYDLK